VKYRDRPFIIATRIALLVVCVSVPLLSQAKPRACFALSQVQIAHAIAGKEVEVEGGDIVLPVRVSASIADPVLDVVSINPFGGQGTASLSRFWVKMTCRIPGTCLPFYAIVTIPKAVTRTDVGLGMVRFNSAGKPSMSGPPTTMPTGSHAILEMDDSRSHIEVSVVSLESGILGHKIRVASIDHKQIYVAEVVSASLLRRSF
jgi:hypothetical protein